MSKDNNDEKIYRSLIESIPVCIKVFTMEGNLVFLNEYGKWEHYLEDKTDKEITDWDYLSCIGAEFREEVEDAIKVAATGETVNLELKHVPGASRHDICSSVFSSFKVDGEERIFAFSVDASQRIKAEKKLKEESRRLINAERIAHLGGFEWDINKDIATVSTELYNILGVKDDYFKEKPFDKFLNIIHPENRNEIKNKFDIAFKNGKSFEYESRILRPDNEVKDVHSKIEIVADNSRKPIKMIGILQDVTDRKKIEEKLKEKIEELERLNKHMVGREIKMKELKERIKGFEN